MHPRRETWRRIDAQALQAVLAAPFDEHPAHEAWAGFPPDWHLPSKSVAPHDRKDPGRPTPNGVRSPPPVARNGLRCYRATPRPSAPSPASTKTGPRAVTTASAAAPLIPAIAGCAAEFREVAEPGAIEDVDRSHGMVRTGTCARSAAHPGTCSWTACPDRLRVIMHEFRLLISPPA